MKILDEPSLSKAATKLHEILGCQVLITRGPQGMTLWDGKGKIEHLPVWGLEQPVDPTGAGDTVSVVSTLVLALGESLMTAGILATVAAGLVVAKRGTATVTSQEIQGALKNGFTKNA
jgi:bifunctional ADP-heptose synthase (sugar kinase/adenylyltransferase)